MMRTAVASAAIAVLLASPAVAGADEITVWTARALATVLAEIGAEFERATGHRLVVISDLPPAFLRRASAGESFDLLITGAPPLAEWIRDGRILADTRTDIARSGIGVEVRAGSRKPDISTVDAFKRALLNAESIAFLRVGSGLYLESLPERLGIARALASRVIRPESDIVSELVAKGEVEIGMTVITQILTTPGVALVGPLPAEVQSYVTFVAGVSPQSRSATAAKQLIRFLGEARAKAVIEAQGMQPVQKLPRARRDLHSFMQERCGLVNRANTCRCAKKTQAFMAAGYVDPRNLLFAQAHVTRVREVAPKTHEDIDALDAAYAAIHRDHPFHVSPDFLAALRGLLAQPKFRSIVGGRPASGGRQ